MIVIQDWIAAIPDEDKHLAYMGEHQAVTREFLLTGPGWETYTDWGFHMDMAFDLSTVTTRDSRQMESTKVDSTENVTDTQVKTTATTLKEKYAVEDVSVDCWSETDIAMLEKTVEEDGIHLVWTVLRQHTQLPGLLRANIRALGINGEVKKTAMMVFVVDPAIEAEAAADLPQSEFEAMEEHMDEMLDAVLKNTQMASFYLESAEAAKLDAQAAASQAENAKIEVDADIADLQNRTASLEGYCASLYAVTYAPQTLTAAQQAQARSNLGLVVDTALDYVSTNPVENRVVKETIDNLGVSLTTWIENIEKKLMTVDTALSLTSKNPVQNQAITNYLSGLETRIGSIDTALDGILAIQQELMGGESV